MGKFSLQSAYPVGSNCVRCRSRELARLLETGRGDVFTLPDRMLFENPRDVLPYALLPTNRPLSDVFRNSVSAPCLRLPRCLFPSDPIPLLKLSDQFVSLPSDDVQVIVCQSAPSLFY